MLRDLIRRRDKACANISVVPSRIMKIICIIWNRELFIKKMPRVLWFN